MCGVRRAQRRCRKRNLELLEDDGEMSGYCADVECERRGVRVGSKDVVTVSVSTPRLPSCLTKNTEGGRRRRAVRWWDEKEVEEEEEEEVDCVPVEGYPGLVRIICPGNDLHDRVITDDEDQIVMMWGGPHLRRWVPDVSYV